MLMLHWLAQIADPLLAGVSTVFALILVPTIFHQWRVKASTIPLMSTVPTLAAFLVAIPVYASLGLWVTASVEVVQAAMWAIVAAQRVRYT